MADRKKKSLRNNRRLTYRPKEAVRSYRPKKLSPLSSYWDPDAARDAMNRILGVPKNPSPLSSYWDPDAARDARDSILDPVLDTSRRFLVGDDQAPTTFPYRLGRGIRGSIETIQGAGQAVGKAASDIQRGVVTTAGRAAGQFSAGLGGDDMPPVADVQAPEYQKTPPTLRRSRQGPTPAALGPTPESQTFGINPLAGMGPNSLRPQQAQAPPIAPIAGPNEKLSEDEATRLQRMTKLGGFSSVDDMLSFRQQFDANAQRAMNQQSRRPVYRTTGPPSQNEALFMSRLAQAEPGVDVEVSLETPAEYVQHLKNLGLNPRYPSVFRTSAGRQAVLEGTGLGQRNLSMGGPSFGRRTAPSNSLPVLAARYGEDVAETPAEKGAQLQRLRRQAKVERLSDPTQQAIRQRRPIDDVLYERTATNQRTMRPARLSPGEQMLLDITQSKDPADRARALNAFRQWNEHATEGQKAQRGLLEKQMLQLRREIYRKDEFGDTMDPEEANERIREYNRLVRSLNKLTGWNIETIEERELPPPLPSSPES